MPLPDHERSINGLIGWANRGEEEISVEFVDRRDEKD
jgi:hypothetical protein